MVRECLIEVEQLTKRYGSRLAVGGVSLTVQAGEVFGLLGPNGAGKTTTMSILATQLGHDAGSARLCGLALGEQTDEVKPLIGLVPQDLALYPSLSARDNLAFFGRIYGLRGAPLGQRIARVLEVVGLEDRAQDAVRTFSGGMKRRLNIAVSLIHEPRIVLMDEPTVGVDPQSRNFIFEHVERMKADGITIFYTTHYMEEAMRLCDRVAIMDQGRILALDTTANLIQTLGGGVIVAGLSEPSGADIALDEIAALPNILSVDPVDGKLKIETKASRPALLELIEHCNRRHLDITSLEVLEPNLESVFLHLTGKRLRQ
jgi:ABC-2 type transport system ATP-binding protein